MKKRIATLFLCIAATSTISFSANADPAKKRMIACMNGNVQACLGTGP